MRPEHFNENADQQPIEGRSVTANVEVVEPMGSEIYLYLDFEGQSVTARIDNVDYEPEVNKSHVLDIEMANARYFDVDTQLTIN